MRYIFILSIFYVLYLYPYERKPVIWDMERIESYKTHNKHIKSITEKANKFINLDPVVVTTKSKSVSGDKHNYESIARYAWPDSLNPNGPYIVRDGFTSPTHGMFDDASLPRFTSVFKCLVEAFFLTHDERYLNKSMTMLDDWFINKETYMYPNFKYGQYIPGRRNNKGYPGSICEAYNLIEVMEGIDLLYSIGCMNKKCDKKVQKWFKQLAKWLISSELGIEMRNVEDNLGVIYDVMLYRIGLFTGQGKICNLAENNFTELRINKHIADDGKQPVELKRNKAFMYSVYNISHFIDFCLMQARSERNCNEECMQKIESAINFLMSFVDHRELFPYLEVSDWDTCKESLYKEKVRANLLKSLIHQQ